MALYAISTPVIGSMLSARTWCWRVLRKRRGDALDYLGALPLKDRPALMGAAAKRGYILTLAEEEHALEAKDALMSELAANE